MNTKMQLFSISRKKKPEYEHGVAHKVYENKLNQDFYADAINQKWCTDFTYLFWQMAASVTIVLFLTYMTEVLLQAFAGIVANGMFLLPRFFFAISSTTFVSSTVFSSLTCIPPYINLLFFYSNLIMLILFITLSYFVYLVTCQSCHIFKSHPHFHFFLSLHFIYYFIRYCIFKNNATLPSKKGWH